MRRYFEIESVHWEEDWWATRTIRWTRALRELRVPLRALYAFYGEAGLRERGYPSWAISDIARIALVPQPRPQLAVSQEPWMRVSHQSRWLSH